MSTRNYQLTAIISMVILLLLYALTQFGYLGPNSIGRTSDEIGPLVVPAGYAFAIWAIIYAGLIIFPLYQWFSRRDSNPIWNKINIWYSINVIANGVWLVFASYEYLILTVLVIILMLISLYEINRHLIEIEGSGTPLNYWTERFVFSVYFAWVTLATVLNVSAALKFYNWSAWGISEEIWAVAMLVIAAVIAGVVTMKYQLRAYAAVVIWAFTALIVKHQGVYPNLVFLSAAVCLIFLGLIIWISRSKMRTA